MWNFEVELLCGTFMWNFEVELLCGTFMWNFYVELGSGTSMWNLEVELFKNSVKSTPKPTTNAYNQLQTFTNI